MSKLLSKFNLFSFLLIALTVMPIIVPLQFAFSYEYVISQISKNDNVYSYQPVINNHGKVAWYSSVMNWSWEIYLYNGSPPPIRLTTDHRMDSPPQINDSGHLTWKVFDQIRLYDGSNVSEIWTGPSLFSLTHPRINNNGHVVWSAEISDWEIILYSGALPALPITDNEFADKYPDINNNGHIVWQRSVDNADSEIFFYDGISTIQLTNNDYEDRNARINDNGDVVWEGQVGNADWEIFFYNGMLPPLQVTANDYDDSFVHISNFGVTWSGKVDNEDWEIFRYDGMNIAQLTDDDYDDLAHGINTNGYVVWRGGADQWDSVNHEIFVYDGTLPYLQLTDNNYHDDNPKINEANCITWEGYDGNEMEIFLACPGWRIAPVVREWDFPWWKSEEYWGFWDPRNPILPYEVDVPEIESKASLRPELSFSRGWYPKKMPSNLPHLFQVGSKIFVGANRFKLSKERLESLITLLGTVSLGQRYNEEIKDSAIKAFKELKDQKKNARIASGHLLQALNAIELDWRVPTLSTKKVKTGKKIAVEFHKVARVVLNGVNKSGELNLTVEGDLPAVVAGFRTVWPVASYQFDFTGALSDHADVSIYFGGLSFSGNPSSLHILEWDGKSYKDITTIVDQSRKVITGRTKKLSTYVIVSPKIENASIQQIFMK